MLVSDKRGGGFGHLQAVVTFWPLWQTCKDREFGRSADAANAFAVRSDDPERGTWGVKRSYHQQVSTRPRLTLVSSPSSSFYFFFASSIPPPPIFYSLQILCRPPLRSTHR